MNNKLFACIVLLLIIAACRNGKQPLPAAESRFADDSVPGFVIADTIIYDVIIQNPNPDDAWIAHCLKGLHHRMLVDSIFGMVYSGKITAYDHLTREKLTPNQVRKIEAAAGFSRDDISMIQFTEVWYMNPGETEIIKKVLAMVLGCNYYTQEGERFNKALFRVEL